jgi:hypothetical protein
VEAASSSAKRAALGVGDQAPANGLLLLARSRPLQMGGRGGAGAATVIIDDRLSRTPLRGRRAAARFSASMQVGRRRQAEATSTAFCPRASAAVATQRTPASVVAGRTVDRYLWGG